MARLKTWQLEHISLAEVLQWLLLEKSFGLNEAQIFVCVKSAKSWDLLRILGAVRYLSKYLNTIFFIWYHIMCMKQALKYLPSYIPLNGTSPFSQTWMGVLLKVFELITKYISGLGIAKMNPNHWHLGFFWRAISMWVKSMPHGIWKVLKWVSITFPKSICCYGETNDVVMGKPMMLRWPHDDIIRIT